MKYTEETIIMKLKNYHRQWQKEAVLFFEILCSSPHICCYNILSVGEKNYDRSELYSSSVINALNISINDIERTVDSVLYQEWVRVNHELSRLIFYSTLLPLEARKIIYYHYFNRESLSSLEDKLFCSRRTVIRLRDSTITQLTEMYNYSTKP